MPYNFHAGNFVDPKTGHSPQDRLEILPKKLRRHELCGACEAWLVSAGHRLGRDDPGAVGHKMPVPPSDECAATPDSLKSERPMPNWVFSPKFPLEAKFACDRRLFNTR